MAEAVLRRAIGRPLRRIATGATTFIVAGLIEVSQPELVPRTAPQMRVHGDSMNSPRDDAYAASDEFLGAGTPRISGPWRIIRDPSKNTRKAPWSRIAAAVGFLFLSLSLPSSTEELRSRLRVWLVAWGSMYSSVLGKSIYTAEVTAE
jgi:hypothetical protein